MLASFGAPIGIFALCAIILLFVVYSIMPGNGLLSSTEAAEIDKEIKEEAQVATNKWNVADMYIVSSEGHPGMPIHGKGGRKVNGSQQDGEAIFLDNSGRDALLANRWSDAYSVVLFDMITENEDEFPIDRLDPVAKDLHPYFYYKESTITVCSTNSEGETTCHTEEIYLLVEAKTIRGWFQFHYEWVEDGSRTYERLKDTTTIETYEYLENYLADRYEVPDSERDFTLQAILNSSEGFNYQKEWMDWLFTNASNYNWVSSTMIPAELKLIFEEAGKEYGIPWWFLAAIAFQESSFRPHVVNDDTGCIGLMQLQPSNWKAYAPELGFDVNADMFNPRAQVYVGAYMLANAGLNSVNWDSPDWKEQTLDVLIYYGGFRGPLARERARKEYAQKIWAYADKFKVEKIGWPVQGEITSPFGVRQHPVYGTLKKHNGIDIAAPMGTPVQSVSGGIVTVASYQGDAGNMVKVQDGLYSYSYMHLSKINVKVGDQISPGTYVGLVGSTGASTGPHLHFEIRDLATNNPINPVMFLGE